MIDERTVRYRDDEAVYAGVDGENLLIPSANPRNHYEAIIVPGSLGVGPNHEMHAETLVEHGLAVCVIDPFGVSRSR